MSDKEGPKLAERPVKEGRKIAEPPKAMQKDTTTGEGANIFKVLRNKSEDDTNSYSSINSDIIKKLKDAGKRASEVMGKKVKTKDEPKFYRREE